MATVTVLTAARMLAIEAASVVSGAISGDNLILTKFDGSTINAGNVRGPAGTGVTDGDKGDVTVASSGASWTIDTNAVTNAKLADMVTLRFKARITGSTGDPEDITGTQATTMLDVFTSALKGLVPASGGGTTNFLRADGTWATPPGGAGISDGDKGDVTVSGSGAVWLVDANAITNAKRAQLATARLRGRVSAGTGDTEDLTGTQATTLLDVFTTALKGLVPASGGGTTNFLRADGTWATPPGGAGISDGDKGDVTVASSGTAWTVDADAITNAKLANVPTATFKGRTTAGTGDPEDLTATQAAALLPAAAATVKGLVTPPGGTTQFLRADGGWATPAGGGSAGTTFHRYSSSAQDGKFGTRPSNATGVDGDFIIDERTGWVYGPKGRLTTNVWPEDPAFMIGSGGSGTYGYAIAENTLDSWRFQNNMGVCEIPVPLIAAGTSVTPATSLRAVEVASVWGTGVSGEIEIGGTAGRFYNQWGNTYDNIGFVKGGSLEFAISKLPGSGGLLYFGLGFQYGPPIPAVTIDSAGALKWGDVAHSVGNSLATVQANDTLYMHSAWGKYDLQLVRGGTLIASSVQFYQDKYSLGGTQGFYFTGGNTTYGNAAHARIKPAMQTVIF